MEAPAVLRTVRIAFGLICLQLIIAAAMVTLHLPPALRSLHEADGIAIWLALFSLAWLARFPKAGRVAEVEREVDPVTAARLAAHATGEAIP